MGQKARSLREGMDALTWGVYKCSVSASCRRKSDSKFIRIERTDYNKIG